MATAPAIDVASLIAIKCKVSSFTVPEKTRHKKYAVEALAATGHSARVPPSLL